MCPNLQNTWSLICLQFAFFSLQIFHFKNSVKMWSLMILAASICKMILERGEQCQSCNSHPPNSHISLLQLLRRYEKKKLLIKHPSVIERCLHIQPLQCIVAWLNLVTLITTFLYADKISEPTDKPRNAWGNWGCI